MGAENYFFILGKWDDSLKIGLSFMQLKLLWLWSTFTDWISSIGEEETEREIEGRRKREERRERER